MESRTADFLIDWTLDNHKEIGFQLIPTRDQLCLCNCRISGIDYVGSGITRDNPNLSRKLAARSMILYLIGSGLIREDQVPEWFPDESEYENEDAEFLALLNES